MTKAVARVIELSRELGSLEERRKQMDARIRELSAELARLSGQKPDGRAPADGVSEKIIEFLTANPGKAFLWSAIAENLQIHKDTARSALARLYRQGMIGKQGRGNYTAK